MDDEIPVRPSLEKMTDRIEGDGRLDVLVRAISPIGRGLARGPLAAPLRGDWLGHALHPLLTDIPIGCWTSAFLLDAVGGRRSRPAARRLIGLGLLSLPATAAAGVVDWDGIADEQRRRVGVVHAASNTVAGILYFMSWRARRNDRHLSGVLLGAAGGAVASVSGYLGGHLAFGRAVGVGERGVSENAEQREDAHALDGMIGA